MMRNFSYHSDGIINLLKNQLIIINMKNFTISMQQFNSIFCGTNCSSMFTMFRSIVEIAAHLKHFMWVKVEINVNDILIGPSGKIQF
jgi:hypothetical protein